MSSSTVRYQPLGQEPDSDPEASATAPPYRGSRHYGINSRGIAVTVTCVMIALVVISLPVLGFMAGERMTRGGCLPEPSVPQYFQTSPELWAGPTPTGSPAFLAQTADFAVANFVPNQPLQTAVPVQGMGKDDESFFRKMGEQSPYFPSPGFGVDEYPLPEGARIIQLQMLSRHGSRYPVSEQLSGLKQRLEDAAGKFKARDELSFLNDWKYQLGANILVPKGRQELFDSGVLHAYMYGQLYDPNSKIIIRTTTQDRMLKSAENFAAGFFGLEWTKNATIEVIIEHRGFNNSLNGDSGCPLAYRDNLYQYVLNEWTKKYLVNATARFQDMTEGFEWTVKDVYDAQSMCPFETGSFGSSRFCSLFTYDEWKAFAYSRDLYFTSCCGFMNPAGRAMGIGYQQEVIARLNNHTLGYSGSQINITLDSSTETFPLNQSLYFDFSHDSNIYSILAAFGLRQFSDWLPLDGPPAEGHNMVSSHITPFGARLDMELILTPRPLLADRSGYADDGGETKYIHFVLNQRTLPLGLSLPGCDVERKDGWCELGAFLTAQKEQEKLARFDDACYGDYPEVNYGDVRDGAPPLA